MSGTRRGYTIATKLLLAAGAAVAESKFARNDLTILLIRLLTTGDATLADILVKALVHRRQTLQKLADVYLKHSAKHDDNDTPIKILDEQAHGRVVALEELGVEILPACAVPEKQRTIWHDPLAQIDLPAAQKLYDAGFRDIEGLDYNGETPLLSFTSRHGCGPARNLDLW